MKTLCVVTCGRKKIWDKQSGLGPIISRQANIGNFARKCIQYAEHFYPSQWRILSAKYGLLHPDTLIRNYNVMFNDPSTNPIAITELRDQLTTSELSI